MSGTCPRCGGSSVHHSRLRDWRERLFSRVTGRAPFRCHACQWRGWRKDTGRHLAPVLREIQPRLTEAEVAQIEIDRAKR